MKLRSSPWGVSSFIPTSLLDRIMLGSLLIIPDPVPVALRDAVPGFVP